MDVDEDKALKQGVELSDVYKTVQTLLPSASSAVLPGREFMIVYKPGLRTISP
jgi:hypothetical protein